MQYGISIPNFRGAATVETFRRVAALAEDTGFDDIWIGDHLVLPYRTRSAHPTAGEVEDSTGALKDWKAVGIRDMEPDDPVYDPLALMGFLAALTSRIRIALGTLVVPLRNPIVAAKMLATLDRLSEGRIILGVGVGWIREEYEAVGASWEDRGAVTDEYLDLMRVLWTEDEPEFSGAFYRLPEGLAFSPKPVGRHIPIWVGGNKAPSRRRAARIGDGWHGMYVSPEELARCREDVFRRMEAQGRDHEGFDISMRVRFEVRSDADPEHPCVGPVSRTVDAIGRYIEAGLTHLQIATPPGPTTDTILDELHRFVTEVRPQI